MAEFIVMPKLGFDMREGVLVGWLKSIGDEVTKGDVIAEIESDKATLELESQVSGTLLNFLAGEGDVVPIGGNLAIVGEPGEDISAVEVVPVPDQVEERGADAQESSLSDTVPAQAAPTNGKFPGGTRATPVARRVASEYGIDLRQVSGSGPAGRIRKKDVEEFAQAAPTAPAPFPVPSAAPSGPVPPLSSLSSTSQAVPTGPESEEIAMSRLRQAIGRRMAESKTTVPHFYVTTEIDMAAALKLRKEINELLAEEHKVTVNDMIVKAAALALVSYPNLNSSFAGDKIIRHNRIHIGTAVAVEGGLLTVVQKDTNIAPLVRVAVDNKEMIARARAGRSRPADFEGSTFTVSNLGAFQVDHFVAIINPPEAAILAVGTAAQIPVVIDGELSVGWRMKATISADHRVTDGAEAAQFMQHFKSIMEEPLRLVI